jgi:hypothetical protein
MPLSGVKTPKTRRSAVSPSRGVIPFVKNQREKYKNFPARQTIRAVPPALTHRNEKSGKIAVEQLLITEKIKFNLKKRNY